MNQSRWLPPLQMLPPPPPINNLSRSQSRASSLDPCDMWLHPIPSSSAQSSNSGETSHTYHSSLEESGNNSPLSALEQHDTNVHGRRATPVPYLLGNPPPSPPSPTTRDPHRCSNSPPPIITIKASRAFFDEGFHVSFKPSRSGSLYELSIQPSSSSSTSSALPEFTVRVS